MKRNAVLLAVFLSLALVGALAAYLAEANFLIPPNSLPTIYIKGDGSVEPSSAPIQQVNQVYTLTSNLTGTTLEVQSDNVVVDGAGHTLSSDNKSSPAILLRGRYNVTVRNFQVNSFCMMYIRVEGSTACTITGNTVVTYQGGAITLNGCKNVTITNNTIYNADTTYDGKGTTVYIGGDYHLVAGNQLFGGVTGINVYGKQNKIINNTFVNVAKNPIYMQGNFTNTVENNTIVNLPSQSPLPSSTLSSSPAIAPTATLSILPTPSPTPTSTMSPSTTLSPSPTSSPTQQPTLSPSPTITAPIYVGPSPSNIMKDYIDMATYGFILAIAIIATFLVVYFKRRRG